MRTYAFLQNNLVTKVEILTEDEYLEQSRIYQLIIDIQDLIITPTIGWVLQGNILVPPSNTIVSLSQQINNKIKSYQEKAPGLLREMYVTNTLQGLTTAQSDQMFDDYSDVVFRLKEGAWPTALYRLSQKQPSGFVTQDSINLWTSIIVANL